VYVLSRDGPVDVASLPRHIGYLGFSEYHPPPEEPLAPTVTPLGLPAWVAGRDAELRVRIVDSLPPDSALVFLRSRPGGSYQGFRLEPAGGYVSTATLPGAALREGPHEFAVTLFRGDSSRTYPGRTRQTPADWNYPPGAAWSADVVAPATPIVLFDPASDAGRLAFTRIGDAGRRGLFRLARSRSTGRPVFHFPLPVDSAGWSPTDYTASLVVAERVRARRGTTGGGGAVRLRLRGLGPRQVLHVTLMEDDGTSWTRPVPVDGSWRELSVPIEALEVGRGVKLPQGFPGEWNYWVGPAEGRGSGGDRPRLEHIERLQLSLRREPGIAAAPDSYGAEVEWVTLEVDATGTAD
jgi:hypothetical protein